MVMGLRTRVLILGCDAGAAVRGYIVSNSSLASEAAVDCGSGCVASVAEDAADWLGASLSRRGLRRGAIERRSVATATLLCNDGGVASVTGIFGKHNKIHLIHLCSMMQHHRNQNIAAVIIRNHHEAYQHHGAEFRSGSTALLRRSDFVEEVFHHPGSEIASPLVLAREEREQFVWREERG